MTCFFTKIFRAYLCIFLTAFYKCFVEDNVEEATGIPLKQTRKDSSDSCLSFEEYYIKDQLFFFPFISTSKGFGRSFQKLAVSGTVSSSSYFQVFYFN